MQHTEIERLAYIKGDLVLAGYARLAGELEAEVDTFDERLDEKFDEGKLEASDAELVAEIESLKAQLNTVQVAQARTNALIDVTLTHLNEGNLSTGKDRREFAKALRADQLRIGRS